MLGIVSVRLVSLRGCWPRGSGSPDLLHKTLGAFDVFRALLQSGEGVLLRTMRTLLGADVSLASVSATKGAVSMTGGPAIAPMLARDQFCMVDTSCIVVLLPLVGPEDEDGDEQPWMRVMEHFPPALYRQRFGT